MMEQMISSQNKENDELWHKLINIFFTKKVDNEDFIYAAVWLSLNLFALTKELRDNVMERFKDPKQFPAIKILGAIEYLYEEEDRESEITLLIQLLQYAPNSQKQIEDVLFDPELSTYYKYSRILLIDDNILDDYEDEDIGGEWSDGDLEVPF
jgi:hypothetical protein